MDTEISRRDILKAAGGTGLAVLFGNRALAFMGDEAEAATVTTCLLTPEVTAGPYWVQENLTRRNVTEGKPGLPLVIRFTVLNAKTCKPIPKADVEIWHCDALGNYSAVNGATTRYLRGHQKAGATGKAEFLTIFPGWYPGRTPHIHMKVQRRRQRRPHRAGVHERGDHAGGLQAEALLEQGRLRHAARIGHDLQPGRRIDG